MTNYNEVINLLNYFQGIKSLYSLTSLNSEWLDFRIDACTYLLGWK